MAPNQCALPLQPNIALEDAEVSGQRFGANYYSRQEFDKLPSGIRIQSVISVDFKTTASNGLIFYVADARHIDYLGLYMVNGQISYGFNCGSGAAIITSEKTYNDGQWHTVVFARKKRQGTLKIDNEIIGMGTSKGNTRSINVNAPYFLGGLAEGVVKEALGNVGEGSVSFPGCIRNLKLGDTEVGNPSYEEPSVRPCSSAFETGIFFAANGGYVQLIDNFKVGRDLEIKLEIRPRSTSGVLMAVHGHMDFLILQLMDGKVVFTTDNGAGPITTVFTPPAINSLCDGNWHFIQANKNKNVVTLLVDGVRAPEEGIGSPQVSAADTNDPLYIGGIPDKSVKGVMTDEDYVGCLRNLQLNDKRHSLAFGQKTGDVQLGSCPVS